MNGIDLFLGEHAMVHRAALTGANSSIEELVFHDLTPELARTRPDAQLNSVAWLIWHMARCEDVGINVLVAGREQVIDDEDWLAKLGVAVRDIGTGNTEEEVDEFSANTDIDELRAYRTSVGLRTREVLGQVDLSALRGPVPGDRIQLAVDSGVLGTNAAWVADLWQGRPTVWFLWLASGHNFMHLAEAQVVRKFAGSPAGR